MSNEICHSALDILVVIGFWSVGFCVRIGNCLNI